MIESLLNPNMHSALFEHRQTTIQVNQHKIGDSQLTLMAGPCAIESAEQIFSIAKYVAESGCQFLRGGIFKPRTSPYAFQGLGLEGLSLMQAAAKEYNLGIITELMDVRLLDKFIEAKVDIIQIGSRNMQNFDLLRELGKTNVPVMLKRGLSATLKEWLSAAEYIAMGGNHNIIFCERGVRGFENSYRNMLDVSAIALIKQETGCPVIADPSHAAGRVDIIPALSKAAIAAGADGLLLETHYNPAQALSDKEQALDENGFRELISSLS